MRTTLWCACCGAPCGRRLTARSASHYAVFEADALGRMPPRSRGVVEAVIDDLGERSAKAQGLGAVITTVRKMAYTDQRVYVHRTDRAINGMLKVGRKNLFIRDHQSGKMNEINPLCVLDFYVHESVQRGGIGKQLFAEMLRRERMDPVEFGYDRPSPKLIGFLRKHYALVDYDPQPNNFVVFKAYFNKTPHARGPAAAGQRQTHSRRRANHEAPDVSEPPGPGVGAADSGGWQRSKPPVQQQTSNSFFLGGSGVPDALCRNSHAQPPQEKLMHTAEYALPPRHAEARRPEPLGAEEDWSRRPGQNSAHPHAVAAGNSAGWTSRLSALAASAALPQHDSLAEFARSRQGSGDPQHGHNPAAGSGTAGWGGAWEREPAQQRLGDFGAATRDKSLQEEATSHFIQGSRRPASGRRAPFTPLASPQVGAGVGAGAVSSTWRTANSEIGGWNKHTSAEGGVGGLAKAALNDRRVGGRLW